MFFLPISALADELFEWNGIALGADSNIKFYAKNHEQAERIFSQAFAEIERLENIFSLYIPTSEISRLNKNGYLKNPSAELVFLTHYAKNLGRKTDGVFDPSVQILWEDSKDLCLINYRNIIVEFDETQCLSINQKARVGICPAMNLGILESLGQLRI
jgi:hypothetical protein